VITSPERTETLKSIVAKFEAANPGTHVEIVSLPWGEAFQKFATMVSAGDLPFFLGLMEHLAERGIHCPLPVKTRDGRSLVNLNRRNAAIVTFLTGIALRRPDAAHCASAAATPEPKKPQDLIGHNCINLRLPTHGGLYSWEFEKGGRDLKVRVEGQMTFNGAAQMLNAALAGYGLAYIPEGMVEPHLAKGRLKRVLGDWCQPYSGYHLFYPSRRQSSAAFTLLVDALRHRG